MAPAAHKTIGEQLRTAREARGWTIAEAAHRTKVKVEQLERLENNQFDLLPSLTYARGFIRIYARELGLDGWALLRQFDGEVESGYDTIDLHPEDLEAIPRRPQPVAMATSQQVGLVVILLVLLVAMVIAGLEIKRYLDRSSHAPVAEKPAEPTAPATDLVEDVPDVTEKKAPRAMPVGTPRAVPVETPAVSSASEPPRAVPVATPAPVAVPAAVPAEVAAITASRTLQLMADPAATENERWVRVVGITGGQESTLFEGFLPPGQALPESGDLWRAEQFIVTLREAAAVDIIFDGRNYGRYDRPGIQRVTLPVQP